MSPWEFRPIARSDFPLLGHWLEQPHVRRWWDDDSSPEGLEADYGGCVDGTEPAEVFIAWRDGDAVGLAQRLRWHAYPEYVDEVQALVRIPPAARSIDYLIGEQTATGKGRGTEMIWEFVVKLWRDSAECPAIIVPVHADNTASWRALERAGFQRIATGLLTPDNAADDGRHVIYRINRPADPGA